MALASALCAGAQKSLAGLLISIFHLGLISRGKRKAVIIVHYRETALTMPKSKRPALK